MAHKHKIRYSLIGGGTLFSDPLLNIGTDCFGALPFLVDAGRFALVFANPADQSLIGLSVINGALPATSVPESATMSLLSIGLLGMFGLRRRKRLIS